MKQVIHNQYLFQEVPEGASGFFEHYGILYTNIESKAKFYRKLPDSGNWQIISKASEASPELQKMVIENKMDLETTLILFNQQK